MQVAVISEPHGDLVALRAVVADLEARELDEVVVAGDLAQGGPQPAEVVDMLVAKGWPTVRGNNDDFLVDLAAGRDFGSDAPAHLIERGRWCVARLGKERVARLAALPMELRRPWAPNGLLVVVHATPWSTEEVVVSDASEEAALRMVNEASAGVLTRPGSYTRPSMWRGPACLCFRRRSPTSTPAQRTRSTRRTPTADRS